MRFLKKSIDGASGKGFGGVWLVDGSDLNSSFPSASLRPTLFFLGSSSPGVAEALDEASTTEEILARFCPDDSINEIQRKVQRKMHNQKKKIS